MAVASIALSGLQGCGRGVSVYELEGTTVRTNDAGIVDFINRADAASRRAARLVVLVSVDGLAPYARKHARTPTLDRLAREGTSFDNAKTVVPCLTLTSHTSMLSGVSPAVHHVLWNHYDTQRKVRTPTLFTRCLEHRRRCALFAGKEKFLHFAELERGVQRYEQQRRADRVIAQALQYIVSSEPEFVFIHLAEVDVAGHAHGWDSPEQHAAIEAIDAELGKLSDALAKVTRPVSLVITADHGGHGTSHGDDVPTDRYIPWIAVGHGIQKLGHTVHPQGVSTMDSAATVLALLGIPAPPGLEGKPVALEPTTEAALSP